MNQATAAELEQDLLLSAQDAEAIFKYRAEHVRFKSLNEIEKVPGTNAAEIKAQEANIEFYANRNAIEPAAL